MAIKIRAIRGDGQSAAGDEFDVVLRDPATNAVLDDVVVRCRVVTKTRAKAIAQSFQERVPDPLNRQMTWRYKDHGAEAVTDAMLVEAIVRWRGIVGADDHELVCIPATIAALDDRLKTQIVMAVFGAEVVDEASFREPARILPVVSDTWSDSPVLSAGGHGGAR